MPVAAPAQQVPAHGRVDVLAYRVVEKAIKKTPVGEFLWDTGLGNLVEAFIADNLPAKNIFAVKPKRRLSA